MKSRSRLFLAFLSLTACRGSGTVDVGASVPDGNRPLRGFRNYTFSQGATRL